jgi:hypothetical protein
MTAGDTFMLRQVLPNYPALYWTLRITLHNAEYAATIEGVADEDDHLLLEDSSTTAQWPPGRYAWTAYVVGIEGERHTLDSAHLIVRPNPATGQPSDGRTHARRMLDALESCLEGRADQGQVDLLRSAYRDHNIERDVEKLMKLRDVYRREVDREDRAQALERGERRPTTVKVRFT